MTYEPLSFKERIDISKKLDNIISNGIVIKDPVYVVAVISKLSSRIGSIENYIRAFLAYPEKAPTRDQAYLINLLISYMNGGDIIEGVKAYLDVMEFDKDSIYADIKPAVVEFKDLNKHITRDMRNSTLSKLLGMENLVKLYTVLLSGE